MNKDCNSAIEDVEEEEFEDTREPKRRKLNQSYFVRFLLHHLPEDITASMMESILKEKDFEITFVNIKVPCAEAFVPLKQNLWRYREVEDDEMDIYDDEEEEDGYSDDEVELPTIFPSCFIEIVTEHSIDTVKKLINQIHLEEHNKDLQTTILYQKQEFNFQSSSHLFYPDIFRQILQYFHSPPIAMNKLNRDNSYVSWFAKLARHTSGSLWKLSDSFYGMKLAMSICGIGFDHIPSIPPLHLHKDIIAAARKSIIQSVKQIYLKNTSWRELFPIPTKLSNDKELMYALVQLDKEYYAHLPQELRNDKEITLLAVQGNCSMLQYASHELRCDKELVKTAVMQDSSAFQYASSFLLEDKVFVLELIGLDWRVLRYVSNALRNDEEVVMYAICRNGLALQYASDKCKSNSQIVIMAMMRDGKALEYASRLAKTSLDVQYFLLRSGITLEKSF